MSNSISDLELTTPNPLIDRRKFMIGLGTLGGAMLLSGSNGRISNESQRNSKDVRIRSILPVPHELIATTAFGIRNRVTTIANLSELYSSGDLLPQKYELDCELTSVAHLLTLLKIFNPKTKHPYTSDDIFELLPHSNNPQIGVHPGIKIPKENDGAISEDKYLPPGPYGIMAPPLAILLNSQILPGTDRKAYYADNSTIPSVNAYTRFINDAISRGSPVCFWHCIDPNPKVTEFEGVKYASGEHTGLIFGEGPKNAEYLDPYNMQVYYLDKEKAFQSSRLVGGGLLTII